MTHLVLILGLGLQAPPAGFDHCTRALADDANGRSAADCARAAAEKTGRWEEAAAWVQSARAQHPKSGWLAFQLAETKNRLRSADAIALYVEASQQFAALGDAGGEVQARVALGAALQGAARSAEAWQEVPRILAAAARSGAPDQRARALLFEVWLSHETGERLGRAGRALHEAESLVFPNGPYELRLRVLFGLGNVAVDLGRYDEALPPFTRVVALAREHGDMPMVALGSSNLLTTRRKQMEARPDAARLPEFTVEARRLIEVADAAGHPAVQAIAHRTLGDLLTSVSATRAEAGPHYERALQYARQATDRNETAQCLWALGRFLSDTHPDRARTLIDEALRMAVEAGSATAVAYAWRQQMRLAWKTLPRERAIDESFRALDAIESIRTLQDVDLARASVLGAWTLDYYWLIGKLLGGDGRSTAGVALGFRAAERMRARALLDAMQGRRSKGLDPRRRDVLREISSQQRRLLEPGLRGAAREAALAELERLERQETNLRAATEPDISLASSRDLSTLDDVQRSLGANEAMLSYAVGVGRNFYGEFAGGAWVFVTTTAGTRVVELPDRRRLEPMLSIYRGVVERASQIDDGPAVALYNALVRGAVDELPPGVTRLVVVPDGSLHHVPFAALRPAPEAAPLGSTYEIAVAPSATVWTRLTQRTSTAGAGTVLALADPVLPDAQTRTAVAQERDWSFEALDLGALAYSRLEGRTVVSRMGRESRLLAGADATEARLRSLAPSVSIVHFATHALIDETRPERSALVLTGGSGGDDGLLQAREIAELRLAGRIVVLSACRSATGAVLAGEGVLGLSRSFFEAGARTVVGTLWPIRDDEAAQFADLFYTALAEGRTVGAAMRSARRAAIAAGLPPSIWASYVVIGDDRIAAPSNRGVRTWRAYFIASGAVLLILLAGVLITRRRRPA